ncbi:hypothetical protein UT300012_22110 [Paraclostridium bifermentans]
MLVFDKMYEGSNQSAATRNVIGAFCSEPKDTAGIIVKDLTLVGSWYENLNRGRFPKEFIDGVTFRKLCDSVCEDVAKYNDLRMPDNCVNLINLVAILKHCYNESDADIEKTATDKFVKKVLGDFTGGLALAALEQVELGLKMNSKLIPALVPKELINILNTNESIRADLAKEIKLNTGILKCYKVSPKVSELFEIIFAQ